MRHAGGYYVVVIEDLDIGKIIGSATLVVEQKFIHNCCLVSINSQYIMHQGRKKELFEKKISSHSAYTIFFNNICMISDVFLKTYLWSY